ncbi:hypothetical protein AC578_631 [Pseudocercospora eumusae]|uniref:WW domain-containing protein n=1 Tax=Pseudocercospora eumusae TaxID=321146 RepID=A0A139HFH8_9PEZI|nr:hypothetical protein AC578_631 [Pseudocercospora eumusae]
MTKHTGVPPGCIGSGYEALRYEPPQRKPKETVVFERPSPAQLGVTSIAAAFTRDGEANNSEDGDQKTYSDRHHSVTDEAGPSNDSTPKSKMLKFINKNLRGEDRVKSAASTYELPLGWSFYTDPASGRLHYIDHSTGKTFDKPPPPRFKFDPNKTPSPREFDTWSLSSSSSISSLDLGTPLIFTKTTTVSAVSEPAPKEQDSPTGTPTLDARLQKRTEYNNTASPSQNTSTPSQHPTPSPSLQTQTPTPAVVPPTHPPHPLVLDEHVVIAQSTNH